MIVSRYTSGHNIKWIVILLALTIPMFFASCKQKTTPKDIIPKEKMALILADVHSMEAYISEERRQYNREEFIEIINVYYCDIFEKHEVTGLLFSESLDYYYTHLDEMKIVYQKVVSELNKEEH